MKCCLTALLLTLTLLLIGCQPQNPSDPAVVMDVYTDAINAHDVEAALQYVADDAVYDRPAGLFQGKEERTFIEHLIAQDVQIELIGERMLDGEKVAWQSHVLLKDPEHPNALPRVIVNNSECIVRDGKILFHTARPAE